MDSIQNKNILIIDTTLSGVSLGLYQNLSEDSSGEFIFLKSHTENYKSAKMLPQLFEDCLKSTNLALTEISAIIASTGPGSFTGIKVGLSFVQGLKQGFSFLNKSPLTIGLSGLNSLREQIHLKDDDKVSLILPQNRKKGYLFGSKIDSETPYSLEIVEDSIIIRQNNAEVSKEEKENLLKSFWLIRPWQEFLKIIPTKICVDKTPEFDLIQKQTLKAMALKYLKSPNSYNNTMIPEPNYINKSTPEERLAQSK